MDHGKIISALLKDARGTAVTRMRRTLADACNEASSTDAVEALNNCALILHQVRKCEKAAINAVKRIETIIDVM